MTFDEEMELEKKQMEWERFRSACMCRLHLLDLWRIYGELGRSPNASLGKSGKTPNGS